MIAVPASLDSRSQSPKQQETPEEPYRRNLGRASRVQAMDKLEPRSP